MLAAGMAQIAKIKSTNAGFAVGTPGTHYVDFGRGSMEMLHGEEAVVTKAQGKSIAEELRDAVTGGTGRSGGVQIVQLVVGGRKLAEVVIPEMPRVLATAGVG